jgi:hypothetical protein
MTDTRAKAKSEVLHALSMTVHLGLHPLQVRKYSRQALAAFDEYCRLDPAQIPAKGRTVCLHCGKPYEEVGDGP